MTLLVHLLGQLLVSTVFAVGALGFVVFPAIAVSAVHKLAGSAGIGPVLKFVPMVGVELAPYLLSLGFLLAVVSTFGRLASDKEWIAIQMAGVHPLRMLLPGLGVALLLGAGTYALLSEVSPRWKVQKDQFRTDALTAGFRNLAPGRTEISFDRFYLSSVSREGNLFRDVQVQISGKEDEFMVADEMQLAVEGDKLFVDCTNIVSVGREGITNAETLKINFDIAEFIETKPRNYDRAKYRTTPQLAAALDGVELTEDRRLEYDFERHRRIAVAFTYLVFLVLGVPTGLWLQGAGQLSGLGVAALYAFAYYILSLRLGRELAESGTLEPWLAAWTTNLGGLLLGVALLYRTVRR